MVTIDAFGAPAAGIRGLFEYVYTAAELLLLPHQSDGITALAQHFGIRWGSYRFLISSSGVRSSGIASVELGGKPLSAPHGFNATVVTLRFAGLPALSAAAVLAVDSDVRTAADNLTLHIVFKKNARPQEEDTDNDTVNTVDTVAKRRGSNLLVPVNCSAADRGLDAASETQIRSFLAAAAAKQLEDTVVCHMGRAALSYSAGRGARCADLKSGAIASLSDPKGNAASLIDMAATASSLFVGMKNLLADYAHYSDPAAAELAKLGGVRWPRGVGY
jgi:hypothetical protein